MARGLGKVTVKRGKVKITSERQHAFLHGRGLAHTHTFKTNGTRRVRHGTRQRLPKGAPSAEAFKRMRASRRRA